MALVPYRVSGPAADQRATERLLQLPGGITLRITQWPALSGAAAPPPPLRPGDCSAAAATPTAARGAPDLEHHHHQQRQLPPPKLNSLANVGLVVWQAGFLLADFLLREAPECARPRRCGGGWGGGGGSAAAAADWRSLTVVDLGTGSGVVGIALALAGAAVYLTDLPHVVPLAAANVAANCDPRVHRVCVCAYRWGDDPAAAAAPPEAQAAESGAAGGNAAERGSGSDVGAGAMASSLAGVEPDVITAADVLYHEDLLQPLMAALRRLSAPHTVSYVSYRVRHGGEVAAFLALAEAGGFAVEEVPGAALHEEYRSGGRGGGGRSSRLGMEDDSDGEEMGELDAGVECVGAGRWAPGTYGILRLCRRDFVPLAPPPAVIPSSGLCGDGVQMWPQEEAA